MTIPDRTDDQRAEALRRAMAVRRERAALRAELKDGRVRAVDVIAGSPDNPAYAVLQVSWLLKALPGLGPVRADRIMTDIGISPTRRLQGLGERQRTELIAKLGAR